MPTRTEIINSFYSQINEDARLQKSRQGQLRHDYVEANRIICFRKAL